MSKRQKKGQVNGLVHINTGNSQWGRVCSDAKILEVRTKSLLLNVFSIRADIIVPKRDACPI